MNFRKKAQRPTLNDTDIDCNLGLSESQINERKAKGWVNEIKIGTSKSYFSIFAGNIFTFFNFLCFLVFLWLISVIDEPGDAKNLTFMVIIVANTLIGIVQEIRAKLTMDKLSLLSSPNVKSLRCGAETEIKLNQILLDDVILLEAGCQICSDSVVVDGKIEVNESLLTGESLPIKKREGDKLMSGSFVVTGKCKSRVVAIAESNYIQKLAMDAKTFKRPESNLIRSLKLIMRIIGVIVIPIAILSFLTNWNTELREIIDFGGGMFKSIAHLSEYSDAQLYSAYKQAVTPTSTAIIGVIPAGLFLLTSMALAVGVLRLSKQKALVQEIYSIETLARVSMLCLDKTGTITDGTMDVKDAVAVNGFKGDISAIISSMNNALSDNNMTATALNKRFSDDAVYKAEFAIPFSSERKCSAVKFEGGDMYLLGAPEFVCGDIDDTLRAELDDYARQGYRCLLLAYNNENIQDSSVIPDKSIPAAIIIIQDNVKSDAKEIIEYFKRNDVAIRVISGDNPITVSEVAKRVGVDNADKYINLHGLSDEEVVKTASEYTVFGRVSPEQKKLLVTTFKSLGHTVAMTGDGINDILALKEADCSIAMANGSEATRNVAQLVLLDSNFASMPKVVGEGRRVINNIERASSLFLTKTALSVAIQLILVFMGATLPLDPIQLSFISFFCIGVPSFFLALEPNNNRIKGSFLVNVSKRVIPNAVAIVLNITLIMIFTTATDILPMEEKMLHTVVMIALYLVYMQILFNICTPFNRNRAILYVVILVWSILCLLLMPLAGDSIVNLFNIVYIKNFGAIMMLIALMYISHNVIKVLTKVLQHVNYKDKHFSFDYDIKEFLKNKYED